MKKFNIVLSVFFAFVLLLIPFSFFALSTSYQSSLLTKQGVLVYPENRLAWNNVAAYLDGDSELDQSIFTEREILHMSDVRLLLDILRYLVMLMLTIFIVLTVFEAISVKWLGLVWTAMVGAGVALVLALLKLIVLAFAFNTMFILFHKIFFLNNLWILDSSSALIKLFSSQFFSTIGLNSLLTTIIISILIIIASGLFLYNEHLKERKSWGKLWRVY